MNKIGRVVSVTKQPVFFCITCCGTFASKTRFSILLLHPIKLSPDTLFKMKRQSLALLTFFSLAIVPVFAQESEAYDSVRVQLLLDSIEQSFKWQTGQVALIGGNASIQVPEGLRYLKAEQSDFVLTQLWGNPPGRGTLGMLFPTTCSPLDDQCFAFNISFDEMGYVKDGDADDIDYTELLTNMQKEAREASAERIKEGYEAIDIVGWAAAPYYDKEKKVLHWAKEIKFGDGENGTTLNYDVRVLGRKGVLSLNAISGMDALDQVKPVLPAVISGVSFDEGHRYGDFDSKIDNVAAWTIGGLVAGKVLAKAGFFAIILKFLKPLLFVVIAGGAAIWRFITGRRKQEEEEAQYAAEALEQPADDPSSTGTVIEDVSTSEPGTESETKPEEPKA